MLEDLAVNQLAAGWSAHKTSTAAIAAVDDCQQVI